MQILFLLMAPAAAAMAADAYGGPGGGEHSTVQTPLEHIPHQPE